ncbi:hypothetical protein BG004_004610 [Podila humilis]|nr:hypothetical protein BG004_004610 [Podila humilis]
MTYELPPIGHALSGGVAAALANVVIYPLDMATTRVQSQSTKSTSSSSTHGHSHREEVKVKEPQPIEFIRPTMPDSHSSSSSATETVESLDESGRKKTTKTIITTTTTTTTRSSTSSSSNKIHYSSVPDAIRKIYASEGFAALYSGLGSDTVATLTSNFVYFYVYMALRRRKEHRRKSGQLSTLQELFLGAEAGIISRFFTAPIHVVTTRQQVMGKAHEQQQQQMGGNGSSSSSKRSKVSARTIIQDIWKQDGISGFWAGYAPTVILSINPSITYFLFETIKKFLVERQLKAVGGMNGGAKRSVLAQAAQLTSLQIFFISACSKAIASFVTYPLILTKTKLQTKVEDDADDDDEGESQGVEPLSKGAEGTDSDKTTIKKKMRFNGIGDVVQTVIRDKGIQGLYTGCQGQVVKGFFSFGLMYMIKDRVVAWMLTMFLAMHNMRHRVADK